MNRDQHAVHCDPETLSLVAFGEQPPAWDRAHLASCARCQTEVADLHRVVSAVLVDVRLDPPVTPPHRVWEAIAATTGVITSPRAVDGGGTLLATDGPSTPGSIRPAAAPPPSQPVESTQPTEPTPSVASLPPLDQSSATDDTTPPAPATRRWRRDDVVVLRPGTGRAAHSARGRWPMIAVAAAALIVGGIAGSSVTRLLSRSTPPATPTAARVIAQTTLAGLPLAPDAKGTAVIVETSAGPRLDVDVSRLGPVPGHFYEVWLIDKNVKNMVPVGILQGTTGDFVVPAVLDLGAYPLVDISIQLPGDPRHSGQSVLRGTTSI
jgi:hypothetical protein